MHETLIVIAEVILLVLASVSLFTLLQQIYWKIQDGSSYMRMALAMLGVPAGVFLAVSITIGWLIFNSLHQNWDLLLLSLIAYGIVSWATIDYLQQNNHRVVRPVTRIPRR